MSVVVLLASVSEMAGQLTFQANAVEGCTPLGVIIAVTNPEPGTISSYSWTITYPNNTTQTASSATYIAILSMPGTYDVSLTINGNETSTISDYITVYGNPTADFTIDDTAGCFPFCVNFTDESTGAAGAQIVEWSWDFGNGAIASDQDPTYCYNAVGTYSPVFSIEDEHGCFDDITVPGMITVSDDFPTSNFSLSSQLDCNPPVSIDMVNNSSGFSPITSEWDFGDGNSTSGAGPLNATHVYSNVGNFDVCLTVTDEIGCEDQMCLPVEIFETAQAVFTSNEVQVCENEQVSFSDISQPVPPQVQWDFDGNGTIDSNLSNPVFSYSQSGVYEPVLIITYSDQCADTLSGAISIEVIDGIDVSFSADTLESCEIPFVVNFSESSTGPGTLQYEWFINGASVSSSDSFVYNFNTFGYFDIQLDVSNEFGCSSTLLQDNYIVVQPPVVTFTHPLTSCSGEDVTMNSISVNSVDPVTSWEWDFDGDGIIDSTDPNPTFTYDNPGQYTISVNIETQNGCIDSFTSQFPITVQLQAQTGFTASTTNTCAGEQIEFCVEYQPGNTYSWNLGDDSGWHTYAYFDTCIVHDYSDTGFFDITLAVFNGACNMTVTYDDFIYIVPPVALYDFTLDCNNLLTVEFLDESIMADSLVWDFGDGSPLVINELNPSHTFPGPGTYDVSLTAFNDTIGCPDVKMQQITLEPPDPVCTFSPTSGCPPLMVDISNQSYNVDWEVTVSNGDYIHVFWNDMLNKWDVTYIHDGVTDHFLYSASYDFWPTLSFEDAGDFDITIVVINEAGCSDTIVYNDIIHVTANPDFASFTLDVVNSCDSVHIGFIPDANNIETFEWTLSDGTILNEANPYHTFLPPFNEADTLWATLSAVDSTGCASTVTQMIDLALPANPFFIIASDPSCQNDVVQFVNFSDGDIADFWWDFGDPLSGDANSSTEEDATHSYAENGTYTVCLTVVNSVGCETTYCNTEGVHIVDPETQFTYTANINNCLYGVSFTNTTPGNVIISEWDFGDGQTGLGINAFHTYPIGVYDVSLVVVNEYGCVDTLVVPDILNYGDVIGPFSQILDTANCTPFQADFSSFNPADTYFDYFWDFDDGNGDPGGVTQTSHLYTQPGTYCPSLIMTDPNGCPVLIECVTPIEVQAFTLSYIEQNAICSGDTLLFNVSGGTSYTWDNISGITAISSDEYYLHPAVTTDYLLTGYYSDCLVTDTVHVTVNSLPAVSLDMPDEICHMEPAFDLYGGFPDDVPGQYMVEGIPATQFDPSQPAGQSYLVEYMYTDTNGCTNTAANLIFINPLPLVTLDAFPESCEDGLPIIMSGGSPAGGQYTYLGDTITQFEPSTGEGSHTIIYTYTDPDGCVNNADTIILIHPVPDALIIYPDICLSDLLVIDNESTIPTGTIVETEWNFGPDGETYNTFEPMPVSYGQIGTYDFSLDMSSDMGCSTHLDTVVHVWAVPEPSFTIMDGCQYTDLVFIDESTIDEGSVTGWIWNAEGQLIDSPDSLVHNFQQWGNQIVTLFAISDHGCTDSLSQQIMVHPAPVLDILFENNCYEDLSVLISDMNIPSGNILTQTWNLGDGSSELQDDDVEHYYPADGSYPITLNALSDQGCTSEVTETIQIYSLPEIDFSANANILCAGQVLSLADSSVIEDPYEIVAWEWLVNESVITNTPEIDLVLPGTGQYDLALYVTSDMGCVQDTILPGFLIVYPKPVASFLADPVVVMAWNPVVNVTNAASEDVVIWHYDFGDGYYGSDPDESHDYTEFGNYMISQTVTNEFGCMDTAYQEIINKPDLLVYVPNSFTPDNDGINEIFKPVLSGFEILTYEFSIFNRWGEKIFTTNNPDEGWTGNVRGGELFTQDGVYTWQANVRPAHDAAIRSYDGHVYMLR